MATGDLIKLGTLYMGATKVPRATKPWRADTMIEDGFGYGNTPSYLSGNLVIKDTDPIDEYKIQWREINDGGKRYLVADRNLLSNISWDTLFAQNLIHGKLIVIDGKEYKIRLLTGGSNYRVPGRGGDAGSPANNEWDRWIGNEAGLSGLYVPSSADVDYALDWAPRFNSNTNMLWNWAAIFSWCQEIYEANNANVTIRGYNSVKIWAYDSPIRSSTVGWRPVLEVLNIGPKISGKDENLGIKYAPFDFGYSVESQNSAGVNVVLKLNGTVIKSDGPTSSIAVSNRLTSEQWAALPLNTQSTIVIEATDSNGVKSTRTYTFTKANSAPTVSIVEPKGDLANIAIVDKITPIVVWTFKDSDPGDAQSAYQVIVENTSGAIVHDSAKKASTQSFYQLPPDVANWGDRLKWKVRVWDKYDVPSEYSFPEFFMPNRPPSVTNLQPGSLDPLVPAPAGDAPIFIWSFEDLDLEAQASYQLKVFKKADDMLVFDSGRVFRNVQEHQVPKGTLSKGAEYYAVLEAWDPNGLSGKAEKVYVRTNATPSTPIMSGPVDNYRTPLRPTLSGIVGTDPEDDGMHFAVEIARDEAFTKNPVVLRSDETRAGWLVNGAEIPAAGVKNDQQGQSVAYTLQFDLDMNRIYYWRIAAVDAKTKAIGDWSKPRKIRVGDTLKMETKTVIKTGQIAARRLLFAADYLISTDGTKKAELKVEFTNNALDINPTWEDATQAFFDMDYHTFTNATKTGTEFAVAARVTIKANDCMGPIYIDAIGMTFD